MDLGLENRVVIIGGSSRGIGEATARSFLAEGARVVVTGRDATALANTAGELEAEFGARRLLAQPADLVSAEQAANVVAATRAKWGRVDCAVANAGTGSGEPGWAPGDSEWGRLLDANLTTSRRVAEAVLPGMVKAGAGSIIFVASIAGVESLGAPIAYGAAKSALLAYGKSLARQVGEGGVRVNAVAPGNVLASDGPWKLKLEQDPAGTRRYIDAEVPLRRFASPQEIADVVVFLASERASFVTGSCVVVDGGQTRRIAI